jgi:type I restriction enzyme S subunit
MSPREHVQLGEVATIVRKTIAPARISDGTTYVGLENIERGGALLNIRSVDRGDLASAKFEFTADQVLFGKLRPYLAKIARPAFDGVCSTDILPITPGPSLDKNYLAHYLLTPGVVALAAARATGANLPRLSPGELAKFQIPLPPLKEQRRIAAILDQAEGLRSKRRAALAHLDDLTQSIFLDMFGDGQDWPVAALRDLVATGDRINYGVVQPGEDVEGGVPLIRVSDLRFGRVDRTRLKLINPVIERKYTRSRIQGNEVLITCVGSTGVIAVASDQDVGSNVARAVTRVPIENPTTRQYVAEHLRSARVQRYFKNELRTVSQPTLNGKQIAETAVPVPPIELQDEFVRRARVIQLAFDAQSTQRGEMKALFASLQSRAFAGEL